MERAPWKEGFYERLVGMIKYHIRRTVAKLYFTFLQLQSELTKIEGIISCRSITFFQMVKLNY